MDRPFEVFPYDFGTLCRVLAEKARTSRSIVEKKTHLEYLRSYFGHLEAATILVENEYIDRDFLEDFAAYYVRCFHNYDRKCARLHFFNLAFSEHEFVALLTGASGRLTAEILQQSYVGFMVVKPLPQTVIGRTCLRSYEDAGVRSYPITRRYEASLFGVNLAVENTLAFQEQDSVVAACATSALWSAFHGTGKLFQHAIPSPVEITRAADVPFSGGSRNLPNRGLTPDQMAQAIRTMELEPFLVRVQDEFVFKNTLYAYLRGHVPVLLVMWLYDTNASDPPVQRGRHAVAVTGYGVQGNILGVNPFNFRSRACSINRIYAHDDQVGPFAKMELDGVTVTDATDGQTWMSLSTSWKTLQGIAGGVRAVPDHILIPLYHKIRIPYDRVQDAVIQFDAVVALFLKVVGSAMNPQMPQLEWDIFLTTVNEFKEEVCKSGKLAGQRRLMILSKPMPRFLWRATAYCGKHAVLDLLFDATDIEQGECFAQVVEYAPPLGDILRVFVNLPPVRTR